MEEMLSTPPMAMLNWNLPLPASWSEPFYGSVTGRDLVLATLVLLGFWLADRWIQAFLTRRQTIRGQGVSSDRWIFQLAHWLRRPARLAWWAGGFYLAALPLISGLPDNAAHPLRLYLQRVADIGLFIALLWSFLRATQLLQPRIRARTAATAPSWDEVVILILFRAAQVIGPLLAIILAAPLLGLPLTYDGVLRKIVTLFIIGAVAWVLVQAVLIMEKAITDHLAREDKDPVRSRSISTQVSLLKRIAIALICVFATGCVLMSFDEVRRVGTSMLASAGLAGIVLGFAAQRALGNLFAGIQIAFTQPMRLGDAVVVEGEWGIVEEITLTYVVIRVWDLRRLVLPISYFIEKPFQNWTRTSPKVVGTVMLYVDYTCPIDSLRAEAKRIIEPSPSWDRRSWNLQLTDATEKTVQVRVMVTAADAGKLWDLRCEVREGLVRWLQTEQPAGLPRVRTELTNWQSGIGPGERTALAAVPEHPSNGA